MDILKKIILVVGIIVLVYLFYDRFIAGTMEPFFGQNKGRVDLLGVSSSLDKVKESE